MIALAFVLASALAADPMVQRGHDLAQGRCSQCHAVETSGASPNSAAPPFRTLGAHYPVENLEEAFAEGAYVGHAEMPNFTLDPLQISDLVAYLKALNSQAAPKPPSHRP